MREKYPVYLSEAEREELKQLIAAGSAPARKIRRAHILLKTDQSAGGPHWTYRQIAETFLVTEGTIRAIRRCYAEQGLAAVLNRKLPEREYAYRLDGLQQAQLMAMACGEPPSGHEHWSLRLLAERYVAMGYVETISYETVRQELKKANLSPG